MLKAPRIQVGETYMSSGTSTVWRVDRLLADGVHVVLVSEDEPTRRKTVAASVLAERHFFMPAGT